MEKNVPLEEGVTFAQLCTKYVHYICIKDIYYLGKYIAVIYKQTIKY